MTKDNLLFALVGILVGFLSGYLLEEAMDSRQPPRAVPGQAALGVPGGGMPGAPGMPGTPGAPGGTGPGMDPGIQAEMARLDQLQQQLQQSPDNPDIVLAFANQSFDFASRHSDPVNWQRARDLYLRYLELRPANPDVLSDLGVTYRELGQYQEALNAFEQAQQMAPDHWQSRYNEVVVLGFDLKQYDKAREVLAELERMQPGNPDIQQLATAVAESEARNKAQS